MLNVQCSTFEFLPGPPALRDRPPGASRGRLRRGYQLLVAELLNVCPEDVVLKPFSIGVSITTKN